MAGSMFTAGHDASRDLVSYNHCHSREHVSTPTLDGTMTKEFKIELPKGNMTWHMRSQVNRPISLKVVSPGGTLIVDAKSHFTTLSCLSSGNFGSIKEGCYTISFPDCQDVKTKTSI